jgi:hypothetical protein
MTVFITGTLDETLSIFYPSSVSIFLEREGISAIKSTKQGRRRVKSELAFNSPPSLFY